MLLLPLVMTEEVGVEVVVEVLEVEVEVECVCCVKSAPF
jgi:hypothetical protein